MALLTAQASALALVVGQVPASVWARAREAQPGYVYRKARAAVPGKETAKEAESSAVEGLESAASTMPWVVNRAGR